MLRRFMSCGAMAWLFWGPIPTAQAQDGCIERCEAREEACVARCAEDDENCIDACYLQVDECLSGCDGGPSTEPSEDERPPEDAETEPDLG